MHAARTPRDIFGFAEILKNLPTDIPPPQNYSARDGEKLACRFYDSTARRILLFIHGSSYHGAGYHNLAQLVSTSGAAKVVLPNLRGHYLSGPTRGDIGYVGQLEDDLADLIATLRVKGWNGPIYIGGHSSGGSLAIRFAGGSYAALADGYTLLAPVIPSPDFMRHGATGGWTDINLPKLLAIALLNKIGIRRFNGAKIITFNKPAEYLDGTETLAYSYRLNASYHTRFDYRHDLRALKNALVLVGGRDQAIDAQALKKAFAENSSSTDYRIFDDIDHFGIFTDPMALQNLTDWLRQQA
jgi:alpha-beta hydrolase superfamily lysophospholipase